jgi:hypothetical protein
MKKKVLIVAADGDWHDIWFRELGTGVVGLDGEVALTSALTAREAADQFTANTDFAAIVVAIGDEDAPITGSLVPLVRSFRAANYTGPIIAVGELDHRRKLVRAGCDHASTMAGLPQALMEILG